jgi:DNA primase
MQTEGVSFRHAVELLRNNSLECSDKILKKNTIPKLESPVTLGAEDNQVLREVALFYHNCLPQEKAVLDYLEKRKLNDERLIEHFHLGYGNRTLGLRLPHRNRKEGAQLREQLQKLGIYRESGHEHLTGSLVIPVLSITGEVKEMYGRKVRDDLRPGTPYHLYLSGPHHGVFNEKHLAHSTFDSLILCESLIDALTFFRYGFENVTSAFGTNGYTEEIHRFICSGRYRQVVIAFDNDEAGNKSALEVVQRLNEEGVECKRLRLPVGYDVNQLAVEVDEEAQVLQDAIDRAEWMGAGELYPKHETAIIAEPVRVESVPEQVQESSDQHKDVDQNESTGLVPEKKGDLLFYTLGTRKYRIAGLYKNRSLELMKTTLLSLIARLFHLIVNC